MFDPERDAALMHRIRGGDPRAFEEIYHLYAGAIARFFHHLTWNRQDVEDGVQEVFLRLWRGAPNWRPTGKFSTYLFQIAKNWWINERAKRSRRIRTVAGDEEGGESPLDGAGDPDPGPEERAERRELADTVRRAVSDLPEKLRITFVLSEYQGMKYADIAEVLEIPVGTVKSRMSAAEKTLRDRLRRQS